MFDLKPLSKDALSRALEKAEWYRLLGEPAEAESICLDVLEADGDNQKALVILLLARTDQFGQGVTASEAREVLPRLRDAYERVYYEGIICERDAKARLVRDGLRADFMVYDRLREAMSRYEKAEAIRPPGNDDAILRWNTCARILMRNPQLRPGPEPNIELPLE